jgi:ribosomal protein S18 acetylase RimI-like enzyme
MVSNLYRSAPAHALTSRLYETEQDFLQMRTMLMEARAHTSDWRYAHVGEMQFNFFMVVCHLIPQEFVRLWHADGKLVGYAILGEDPSFTCQILPEYEWTGIEAEALAWAEARVAELRKQDPKQWSGNLVSGARQDDAKRLAFLEQNGFRYRGDFSEVNMLRSLDEPIPAPTVPPGFQVRALAETGEASLRAAAHREVWLPWSDGDVSDEDYARLMKMPGYLRDLDVVTVAPEGVMAACVTGWLDPLNRIGDCGSVGTLPAYRRQGLMRAALLECLQRMKLHGMERACVSTGVENWPAVHLYESVGFKIVNKYRDYVKTG